MVLEVFGGFFTRGGVGFVVFCGFFKRFFSCPF